MTARLARSVREELAEFQESTRNAVLKAGPDAPGQERQLVINGAVVLLQIRWKHSKGDELVARSAWFLDGKHHGFNSLVRALRTRGIE